MQTDTPSTVPRELMLLGKVGEQEEQAALLLQAASLTVPGSCHAPPHLPHLTPFPCSPGGPAQHCSPADHASDWQHPSQLPQGGESDDRSRVNARDIIIVVVAEMKTVMMQ